MPVREKIIPTIVFFLGFFGALFLLVILIYTWGENAWDTNFGLAAFIFILSAGGIIVSREWTFPYFQVYEKGITESVYPFPIYKKGPKEIERFYRWQDLRSYCIRKNEIAPNIIIRCKRLGYGDRYRYPFKEPIDLIKSKLEENRITEDEY